MAGNRDGDRERQRQRTCTVTITTGTSAPGLRGGRAALCRSAPGAARWVSRAALVRCRPDEMQVHVFERRHLGPHLEDVGAGVHQRADQRRRSRSASGSVRVRAPSVDCRCRIEPPGVLEVRLRAAANANDDAAGRQPPAQRVRRVDRDEPRPAGRPRGPRAARPRRGCAWRARIAQPRADALRAAREPSREISGSRPEVGSSSSRTGGSCRSARRARPSAACPSRAQRPARPMARAGHSRASRSRSMAASGRSTP